VVGSEPAGKLTRVLAVAVSLSEVSWPALSGKSTTWRRVATRSFHAGAAIGS